ncbi:MAG: excinuclease ATPase subunit [Porticoccaceae bacterium]|nr:excinuclease ATPase subunit [Porticoccaceae bacterium]
MHLKLALVFALVALFSLPGHARDTKHLLSIDEAMSSADFQERLDPNVRLYFGDTPHPQPLQRRGEYVSNKKTNAVGKSDRRACEWVLLSALLSLQERAVAEGGNAVVNIRSYYKKNTFSSTTEYECHTGAVIAGVALKGEVVKLP